VSEGKRDIFITGGTGYMGRQLIPRLLQRGHEVRALVRPGSEGKLPLGCNSVIGDALIRETFAEKIAPADTFVQLVGVSHPSPAKAALFQSVDLIAGKASIEAATNASVRHFVYLSVAQPAPVMKAYIAVRAECEEMIKHRGLNASILRPWYVLGPAHRWPYLLMPIYWALEKLPPTREAAQRLGLVSLDQMIAALVRAVESPVSGVHIIGVPQIRAAAKLS
jgi:uncharacterized protein YbjT (DUF2867 family)